MPGFDFQGLPSGGTFNVVGNVKLFLVKQRQILVMQKKKKTRTYGAYGHGVFVLYTFISFIYSAPSNQMH